MTIRTVGKRTRRLVNVDVPPNPALGGSVNAIAEHLLIHSNAPFKLHLNLTDEYSAGYRELAEILAAIVQCEGVTIGKGDPMGRGPTSGRFESPIGLTRLASGEEVKSLIRFRPEIIEDARAKLQAASIDEVLALHGNIFDAGGWESSKLRPDEASRLAEAIRALNPSMTVVIVGADAKLLIEQVLPTGVKLGSELGLNAKEQMALVQFAAAFVGMSSGPSVFATMSDVPYVIIKNHRHHKDLVDELLSGENKFPFAGERQDFYVARDTFDCELPTILQRVSMMLKGKPALEI